MILINTISKVFFRSLPALALTFSCYASQPFKVDDHKELIRLIEERNTESVQQFYVIKEKLKEDFFSEDVTHQAKVRTYLAHLIALLGDLESAKVCVLPLAESDFAPAQFLLAGCLEELNAPKEAVSWYMRATLNEDEDALGALLKHSHTLSSDHPIGIYATYALAEYYSINGKTKEFKDSLTHLLQVKQTIYSDCLLQGLICEKDGNYPKALEHYHTGKETDPECSSRFEAILSNPSRFIQCLECKYLEQEELLKGFTNLIKECRSENNVRIRKKFEKVAAEHPRTAYLYAIYLLKNALNPQSTKKKKKNKNKKKKSSCLIRENDISTIIQHLRFAEQKGYPGASEQLKRFEQTLEKIVGKAHAEFYFPKAHPKLENNSGKKPQNGHKKDRSPHKSKKIWSDYLKEAATFEHQGEFDLAKPAYEKACETNDPEALFNSGSFRYNLYKREKNPDDLTHALRSLAKASAKGYLLATLNLGDIYYETGALKRAKSYWLEAHNKGVIQATYKLGVYYLDDKKDEKKAKPYLDTAQQYKFTLAYHKYGGYMKNKGHSKDACLYFYAGARLKSKLCLQELQILADKDYKPALLYLGIHNYYIGDIATTLATWKKVDLLNDPELDVLLFLHYGLLALSQNFHDQAEEWLTKANASLTSPSELLIPLYIDVYGNLGNHFQDIPNPSKARECWENALELAPQNTSLMKLLGEHDVKHGRVDEGVKRLCRAIELGENEVDQILKDIYLDAHHPGIAAILGTLYLKIGICGDTSKFRDAETYLMIAYREGNEIVHENTLYNLISLHLKLLNYDKVLEYAKESVSLKALEFLTLLDTTETDRKKLTKDERKLDKLKQRILDALKNGVLKKIDIDKKILAELSQTETPTKLEK